MYNWRIGKILKLHECQEQATWVADALSGAAAQTQINLTNKQINTANKVSGANDYLANIYFKYPFNTLLILFQVKVVC